MAQEKKIQHMEIHLAHPHDGKFHGAVVEHHFERTPAHTAGRGVFMSEAHEPEKHTFGEGDGHEMLAHIANNANVSEQGADAESDSEDQGEAGEEA